MLTNNYDYTTNPYLLSQSKKMNTEFRESLNLDTSYLISEELIQQNYKLFKLICMTNGCTETLGRRYLLDRR